MRHPIHAVPTGHLHRTPRFLRHRVWCRGLHVRPIRLLHHLGLVRGKIPVHVQHCAQAHRLSRKKQKINQCELLVVIAAVMTFGDIFRDRELLVWVDNVPALSAAVHGYSHAPEMASLSNALHLLFAGLSAAPRFLHVPGKANPAGIPSRVPFVRRDGSHALDPDRLRPAAARVVAALRACYRPMALPTAAQLGTREYFICRGVG